MSLSFCVTISLVFIHNYDIDTATLPQKSGDVGSTLTADSVTPTAALPPARTTSTDPSAVNCESLLHDFRFGKIQEVERKKGLEKPFILRTITDNPFYWSCHQPDLDRARRTSCELGYYYEKHLSQRIVEVFKKKAQNGEESIMLDVGGNIGWFSLLAAAHGASKVFTLEPNPSNVVRICESLSLNHWGDDGTGQRKKPTVIPFMKGAGAKDEKLRLYRTSETNPGLFSFSEKRASMLLGKDSFVDDIDVVTLDTFAEERGWFKTRPSIGFFKLDVEGYEARIMEGGKKLFKSGVVEWFSVEVKTGEKMLNKKDKRIMMEVLFKSGYELHMHGGYRGPNSVVEKKYATWEDLAEDVINNVYLDNLLFRKI